MTKSDIATIAAESGCDQATIRKFCSGGTVRKELASKIAYAITDAEHRLDLETTLDVDWIVVLQWCERIIDCEDVSVAFARIEDIDDR